MQQLPVHQVMLDKPGVPSYILAGWIYIRREIYRKTCSAKEEEQEEEDEKIKWNKIKIKKKMYLYRLYMNTRTWMRLYTRKYPTYSWVSLARDKDKRAFEPQRPWEIFALKWHLRTDWRTTSSCTSILRSWSTPYIYFCFIPRYTFIIIWSKAWRKKK